MGHFQFVFFLGSVIDLKFTQFSNGWLCLRYILFVCTLMGFIKHKQWLYQWDRTCWVWFLIRFNKFLLGFIWGRVKKLKDCIFVANTVFLFLIFFWIILNRSHVLFENLLMALLQARLEYVENTGFIFIWGIVWGSWVIMLMSACG